MTEPFLMRARELAAYEIPRGLAFETGILNGYCDEGSLVKDKIDEAKLDILKHTVENNPDD